MDQSQKSFNNQGDMIPSELKGDNSTFKTSVNIEEVPKVFQVEDVEPIQPEYIDLDAISAEELCERYLPKQVLYERVIKNITQALTLKVQRKNKTGKKKKSNSKRKRQFQKGQQKSQMQLNRIEANKKRKEALINLYDQIWDGYLKSKQTRLIIIDAFWYSFCKFFNPGQYEEHETFYLKRIAENYINFFFEVEKEHREQFYNKYFNLISQGVFYSFFYAFPISRPRFNRKLAKDILTTFSYQFTGIKFSNLNKLLKDWFLDLGTGNVLKISEEYQSNLPDINKYSSLKKLSKKSTGIKYKKKNYTVMQYSRLVDSYLKDKNYQTRNYVRKFQMKTKNLGDNIREKEKIFIGYKKRAKRILEKCKKLQEDDNTNTQKLNEFINKIKQESRDHQLRLENRQKEELDKGAHEYANYLVSMLNSGLDNLVFDPYNS